jgi:hypothetical protein
VLCEHKAGREQDQRQGDDWPHGEPSRRQIA